jgi:N-acetylmuramic acid 6-phosphate etherase
MADPAEAAAAANQLDTLATEQARPDLADLDLRPTLELVCLINAEDATVAAAVADAAPAIAAAVDAIADRLDTGGRLIYLGAGSAGRIAALDAAECAPTFGVAPG